MKARESVLETPELHDLKELFPIMQDGMSDSATLDNVFEFLTMAGMSMPNVLSVLIPESWNNKNPIPDSLKAYYEYNSILMEPWTLRPPCFSRTEDTPAVCWTGTASVLPDIR